MGLGCNRLGYQVYMAAQGSGANALDRDIWLMLA
jgi:hypothetical protein